MSKPRPSRAKPRPEPQEGQVWSSWSGKRHVIEVLRTPEGLLTAVIAWSVKPSDPKRYRADEWERFARHARLASGPGAEPEVKP